MNRRISQVTGEVIPTETYLRCLMHITKYPAKSIKLASSQYVSLVTHRQIPITFVTTVLTLGKGA
jgi:hypothetical protein